MFPVEVMGMLEGDGVMVVVLRSFTDRGDPEAGLALKEIRGYRVLLEREIQFQQNRGRR